ncbi:MAG: hypothetical protein C5B45_06320 [Chlamydiae bacterium]|nr:MAG: hypothetical protein C5B45_06320 [Chlamydiota bacterium]
MIPGKVHEKAQELFFQELQKLEKELSQTDQLLYLDKVHPQHKPSYGWFEKGLEVTTVSSDSIHAQSTNLSIGFN